MKAVILTGLFLSALLAVPALAQSSSVVTEEMMVKTADTGIEIYVRNKRPLGMTTFRPEQTVLYVHGATYPSETTSNEVVQHTSPGGRSPTSGYVCRCAAIRGHAEIRGT